MICAFNNLQVTLGNSPVLDQLTWQLPKGQVTGLLGKNGAGKSTLIRTMLGLILPSAGAVHTLGVVPRDMGDAEKARLAYVPQTAVGYEGMRVSDAIAVHASCYDKWDHALAERMIARFELPLKHRVQTLSVGQRQALMLVFALASKPELLIMDEPVASLDPAARREVLQFIAETADDHCTILYSTHITADLNRMADQIAMLAGGKIQFCKSAESIHQTVLVKGELPEALVADMTAKEKLLQRNGREALVCAWEAAWTAELPKEVLVQPLNLEEVFIRWHLLYAGQSAMRCH